MAHQSLYIQGIQPWVLIFPFWCQKIIYPNLVQFDLRLFCIGGLVPCSTTPISQFSFLPKHMLTITFSWSTKRKGISVSLNIFCPSPTFPFGPNTFNHYFNSVHPKFFNLHEFHHIMVNLYSKFCFMVISYFGYRQDLSCIGMDNFQKETETSMSNFILYINENSRMLL